MSSRFRPMLDGSDATRDVGIELRFAEATSGPRLDAPRAGGDVGAAPTVGAAGGVAPAGTAATRRRAGVRSDCPPARRALRASCDCSAAPVCWRASGPPSRRSSSVVSRPASRAGAPPRWPRAAPSALPTPAALSRPVNHCAPRCWPARCARGHVGGAAPRCRRRPRSPCGAAAEGDLQLVDSSSVPVLRTETARAPAPRRFGVALR